MRAFHARDWGSNPHSSTLPLIVLFSKFHTLQQTLKFTCCLSPGTKQAFGIPQQMNGEKS